MTGYAAINEALEMVRDQNSPLREAIGRNPRKQAINGQVIRAVIPGQPSIDDLADLIRKAYFQDVAAEILADGLSSSIDTSSVLRFSDKKGMKRSLCINRDRYSPYYFAPSTEISLSEIGDGEAILRAILSETGGYLLKNEVEVTTISEFVAKAERPDYCCGCDCGGCEARAQEASAT